MGGVLTKKAFYTALALILAVVSLVALPAEAVAAGGVEEKFPDVNDFYADGIADVGTGWGLSGIVAAYDTGLMMGTDVGVFSPRTTFTVAQAVTVAVRIQGALEGYDAEARKGEKWYSGYVELARSHRILEAGEYATDKALTSPVTRGQMAKIFYNAVSGTFGQADKLNDIVHIGDVEAGSVWYEPVRALMELGILTGYDSYGTFKPDDLITREEAAAVVARVVRPKLRVAFTTQEKPDGPGELTDLTVYTSNRLVCLDGVYFAGVLEIGGEFFLPVEGLTEHGEDVYYWTGFRNSNKFNFYQPEENGETYYTLRFDPRYSQPEEAVAVYQPTCSRRVVGTAEMSPYPLQLETVVGDFEYETRRVSNAIATLGGEYPMLRLSVLGYKDDGYTLRLNSVDPSRPVEYEPDLLGEVLPSLQKGTAYDTVRALHDYLVNTVTYDPTVMPAPYFTRAMIQKAYDDIMAAYDAYSAPYNVVLASRYAVCDGYSKTFLEMCLRSGIPCQRARGSTRNIDHAWNKVYIDGEWKYVDCTWDDPVADKPMLVYNYFLVDADTLAEDHFWTEEDYPLPLKNPPWDEWAKIDPNKITSANDFRKRLLYEIHAGNTTVVLTTTGSKAYGGIDCINLLHEYGEGILGTVSVSKSKNVYRITIKEELYPGIILG